MFLNDVSISWFLTNCLCMCYATISHHEFALFDCTSLHPIVCMFVYVLALK